MARGVGSESPSSISIGAQTRRRKRAKPGVRAGKERSKYLKKIGTVLPRVPFRSLVHQICEEMLFDRHIFENTRFTRDAILQLQVYMEDRLLKFFRRAAQIATHAGRQTMTGEDLLLVDMISEAPVLEGVDV